jgi:hypothetical protein
MAENNLFQLAQVVTELPLLHHHHHHHGQEHQQPSSPLPNNARPNETRHPLLARKVIEKKNQVFYI